MQDTLPPAVPAGGADEDDDGEADQAGGHPAVQDQHGEGEGGAGARAAPPAVAAEGHEVADHDAGEDGEGPAGRPAGEQGVALAHGAVEAGGERDAREGHDDGGQPGEDAVAGRRAPRSGTRTRTRDRVGTLGRFHSVPLTAGGAVASAS